jgi:hypothetical protein
MKTTNYGKIIAITLSVVTCACAIAFVLYRLLRNLIEFCNTYELPEEEELDFAELEEDVCEDAPAECAEEAAEIIAE